jgi:hypothetical protein
MAKQKKKGNWFTNYASDVVSGKIARTGIEKLASNLKQIRESGDGTKLLQYTGIGGITGKLLGKAAGKVAGKTAGKVSGGITKSFRSAAERSTSEQQAYLSSIQNAKMTRQLKSDARRAKGALNRAAEIQGKPHPYPKRPENLPEGIARVVNKELAKPNPRKKQLEQHVKWLQKGNVKGKVKK